MKQFAAKQIRISKNSEESGSKSIVFFKKSDIIKIMNWLRFIFTTALLVIFVTTTLVSVFGVGRVLMAIFRAYVFKVETCEYRYKPMQRLSDTKEIPSLPALPEEPERECGVDYNRAKEDVSNGLAMFIAAFPLAVIFFRKTRKFLYES